MKKLICSIFSIAMILTLNTSPLHAEDTGGSSGGTVILPTEEPTVQQSNQSTAAPEQTGEDAPASPSATAEASADPTAAPAVTADPSAAPTPATDAEETTAPEATVTPEATPTPEATADPSASPSSAPVLKAPMMAPAVPENTTVTQEDAVAQIGDVYYSSLQTAVDEVKDGETITLLQDISYSYDEFPENNSGFIVFDKGENTTVTLDFNTHSITLPPSDSTTDRSSRNYVGSNLFLKLCSGNVVFTNGSIDGGESAELGLVSEYDSVTKKHQQHTNLKFDNMTVTKVHILGVLHPYLISPSYADYIDWDRLSATGSVFGNCCFDTVQAKIENSYLINPYFKDWDDVYHGPLTFKSSLIESEPWIDRSKSSNVRDLDWLVVENGSEGGQPFNPNTIVYFSDSLVIHTLSANYIPLMGAMTGEAANFPYWYNYGGYGVNIHASSFMYDDWRYAGDRPEFEISWDDPTKFIGADNYGYSFAAKYDGTKIMASQTIAEMARGVTQDQDGNPEDSADKYMFVPGDADITLQFQDYQDIPVNIEFSYESEGYNSTPAKYSLKDGETTKSFPLPAWTITGYDQKKRAIIKDPTTIDQLSVTASTGDPKLDSQYTFAITECKPSEDGTHFSITVAAKKIDPNKEYTIVYDANGGDNAPASAIYTSAGNLTSPDTENMRRLDYKFSGKWFLDKECKIPFNYFGQTLGSVLGYLNSKHFVSEDNTIKLYAGWNWDKIFLIDFVLNPDGINIHYGNYSSPQLNPEIGSIVGNAPNLNDVYSDEAVFTGWYYDKECTKPFKYFGRRFDEKLLAIFQEYGKVFNDTDGSYCQLMLYGGWKKEEYKIDFEANLPEGATVKADNIPANETISLNDTISQPEAIPTDPDKELVFMGWYLDKECNKPFIFGQKLNKDNAEEIGFDKNDTLTLFAGWDDANYTLTYLANDGAWENGVKERSVTTSKTITQKILSDLPTRAGYKFTYWEGSEGSVFKLNQDYKGEGTRNKFGRPVDHTMKAQWEPKVYTVKYNANSSKASGAPDSAIVTFDQDAINKPDTSRMTNEGKTFTGWYLDSTCKVPFDYFNKKMDENTLSSLTKAGAIDSNDTITLYAGWKAAAAPSAIPFATASTPSKTSNGSIFFPITSAQKFIPATGAGGGNNN